MAPTPQQPQVGTDELLRAHGAELHRLAAGLTGDAAAATRLVGLTAAHSAAGTHEQQLRTTLVRHYLHSAPRRGDRTVPTTARDAGDVLRTLRPKARAALALRTLCGASTAEIGRTVRVAPERVDRLVPATPGLDVAIAAVADQHTLTGPRLQEDLTEAVAQAPATTPHTSRRRWWWAAAVVVPLLALGGYALSLDRDDDASEDAGPSIGPDLVDLSEAGWELDEDGEPPGRPMGLRLQESTELRPGRPVQLNWSSAQQYGVSFAVLWCDMPPTQDDNLRPPSGTVTVTGERLEIPCAGRDGSPGVTIDHLVALPPQGSAQAEVTGDLPPDGGAVLALYTEVGGYQETPFPSGSRTDSPRVPADAVVVDEPSIRAFPSDGRRLVETVEIGAQSTIHVWAGRTGAVTVLVDGWPVTDDGDIADMLSGRPTWRDRQVDIQQGRWLVVAPGSEREFTLPEGLRPAQGERREVAVEVIAENNGDHVQVVATDAVAREVDTSPLEPVADPDVPSLVAGHRLVAAWETPWDGRPREVRSLPSSASDPSWMMLAPPQVAGEDPLADSRVYMPFWGGFWSEGVLQDGEQTMPLWPLQDVGEISVTLAEGWYGDPATGGTEGPLRVAAPTAPGQPTTLLLAYERVPYEEFDFAAATVPSTAWPPGEDRPPDQPAWSQTLESGEVAAVVVPEDLDDDGSVTVEVRHGEVGARITTEGKGRIRFLQDGRPVDQLGRTDGWWSSWTDQAVTSETVVTWSGTARSEELTIEVQDYEDFRIELLTL